MTNVSEIRKRMTAALIVMVVVAVISAIYLWLPVTSSTAQLTEEARQAREELHEKQRQVAPLGNLDEKLTTARQQIQEFEKNRFPAHYSEISEQMGKLASDAGVKLSDIKYAASPTKVGVQQLKISATLSGDYSRVVKFIHAAEQSKMFLLVDQVGLAERQQGQVGLQISMETYLTGATVPAVQQTGD